MSDVEVHGPIDFVLIEFESDKLDGSAGAALLDLMDQGIIQVYDIIIIQKADDGSVTGVDIADLGSDVGAFLAFDGARSGLLSDDDLVAAGEAMNPGTTAAAIVYENTWARPFVAAAAKAGGQMIASVRIPAADVIAALDALDG